jgi:hypothetical protein
MKNLPKFLQIINPLVTELDRLTGKRAIASRQKKEPSAQFSVLKKDG